MSNDADALDSLDDDWLMVESPEDGGQGFSVVHPGDVESWPAPRRTPNWPSARFGPAIDDRNFATYPMRGSAHSRGPFDAYSFLRSRDPFGDNARGWGDSVDRILPMSEDAGNIYDDVSKAHHEFIDAMNRFGLKPPLNHDQKTDRDRAVQGMYAAIQNGAKTGDAWKVVEQQNRRAEELVKQFWAPYAVPPQAKAYVYQQFQNLSKMMPGEPGLLSKIGSGIGSVAMGIARPVGGLLLSPVHLASDIAHGKNVFGALKDTVKRDISNVGAVAPYVQAVLSVVPGVGTGINAAIAAGAALAQGRNITDALVSSVKAMVPGGPLAAAALENAYKIAKGGNVLASALDVARSQVPDGPAKAAFDTGVALAHGANLQQTLVSQGTALASSYAPQALSFAKDKGMSVISEIAKMAPNVTRPLSNLGPVIGTAVASASKMGSLVPTEVRMTAQSILKDPSLRSLPISDLARKIGVPIHSARSAVASLVDTVSKAGGPSVPHMGVARALEEKLPTDISFDGAMAAFASKAAPRQFSHNARRIIQWSRGPQGNFMSRVTEARGLSAGGIAYVVDPGDTMSKIAQKLVGSSARWPELAKQNPQVTNPSAIRIGQSLDLPISWRKSVQNGPSVAPIGPAVVASATVPTGIANSPLGSISTTHATIRQGSTGPDVLLWQGVIGVTIDGKFGPATAAATKSWQGAHGLTADGVVGPATWARAFSSPTVSVTPVSTGPTTTVVTYVVHPNDSPFKIAQAWTGNGSRFPELADANASERTNILAGRIRAGQILSIPPSWGAAPNGSPAPVAPVSVPQIVAQLPTVLPQILAGIPALGGSDWHLPTPSPTGSSPMSETVPSTVPSVFTPATQSSTTQTPDGPVTQTTTPSTALTTVTQPPIGGDLPVVGPIAKSLNMSPMVIGGAILLAGIVLFGQGSSSKLI